ncbi:MAG: ComF family protein [Pyrinomonadaceae bacterium]
MFGEATTVCWKCGRPARSLVARDKQDQVRCHTCDEHAYSAARACGVYEAALRAVVLALKREPYLPEHLVQLLGTAARRPPLDRTSVIIPVPLHPAREKARGFNQAALIASAVSKCVGVPMNEVSVERVTHSEKYRAGLDAKGRQETVANAFTVVHQKLINKEEVLLVDDVFTTGATVSACADVLLAAGASRVFVLTIARTVR